MNKKPLLIIAGPTAVGKTAFSLELAERIGGEIVSADSMQVYRGMDIGSAKATAEERARVPHHLIDVLEPTEEFNIVRFQNLAHEAMKGIYGRGRIPILTGGTGFYIQSVLYDIAFTEHETDPAYRASLYRQAEEEGADALFARLVEVDPESAAAIPKNNVKRIARALEFFHETGLPISAHNAAERAKESPYDFRYFVLTMDRKRLYERIGLRVDRMMEDGFLEEVRRLKAQGCTGDMTSMQGLGYRQLLRYLNGEGTLSEAVEQTKTETRHFAKRQLTWFRRERDTVWIDVEKENPIDVYETRPVG
ncbi:MAG: tRNA (adenosine(37)-N6)-dimethylallyltransferase MiaA [Lachnospiraceae bacterium]|nr:tRNA (adenosine(37)-N6)-dimethylallyltransferase MiaA [Lachnospiraceae bacterium]